MSPTPDKRDSLEELRRKYRRLRAKHGPARRREDVVRRLVLFMKAARARN